MTQSPNPFHFKNVGDLFPTNAMRFELNTNCMDIAIALLSSHQSGGPVVDNAGRFQGFVSEFDLLKALDISTDITKVTAQEIMSTERNLVHDDTAIKDAVQLMEEKHLLNFSVEEQGVVTKTYSRHDILRGYLGVDLGVDEE